MTDINKQALLPFIEQAEKALADEHLQEFMVTRPIAEKMLVAMKQATQPSAWQPIDTAVDKE